MKKIKNATSLSDEDLLKTYTEATCEVILCKVSSIELEEIINGIYIKSIKGSSMYEIAKRFEAQMVLAKTKPDLFKKGLHSFFKKTAEYIKQSGYKEYFRFSASIYIALQKKPEAIFMAFQDMLLQEYYYLGGLDKVVYSVSDDGKKLFKVSEIAKGMNKINSYITSCRKNKQQVSFLKIKSMAKLYGKSIESVQDFEEWIRYEQVVVNNLFQMCFYMDDSTRDMFPSKIRSPFIMINLDKEFYGGDMYSKLLDSLVMRDTTLPGGGVKCMINSNGIRSIEFREVYGNEMVVVYSVDFGKDGELMGFYIPQRKLFYSMWKDCNAYESTHIPLACMVLTLYSELVKSERWYNLKINRLREILGSDDMEMLICDDSVGNVNRRGDRASITGKQYKTLFKKISPFLRRLPEGFNASDEAKKQADLYGIVLKKGYTFVKPFSKAVRVDEVQKYPNKSIKK